MNCSDGTHEVTGSCNYDADFIVVGAGAGGSVVAARLIQQGFTVLVVEAGPDTAPTSTDPNTQLGVADILVPLNFTRTWNRFNRSGESPNCGGWYPTESLLDFMTTNQNGQTYAYPRGTGAGGSTAHHAMQDGIGALQIYDEIATLVGDSYWNGANMKRLFNQMESYNTPVSVVDGITPTSSAHGHSGWLKVRQPDNLDSMSLNIINASNAMGVPTLSDFGSTADGIGPADIQVGPDGLRSYGYKDLLLPVMAANPGRCTVVFNSLVDKVKFNCDMKAIGVKTYNKAYLQKVQVGGSTFAPNGSGDCTATRPSATATLPTPTHYRARYEVILCAGAIQTPTILMRSGVGPKAHLQSKGIKVKVDAPGVGSQITDHNEAVISFEFDPRKYISRFIAGIYMATGLVNLVPDPVIKANILAAANSTIFNENTGEIQLDWFSGVPGKPYHDFHAVPYNTFFTNFDVTLDAPSDPADTHGEHNRKNMIPDRNDPLNQAGVPLKGLLTAEQYDPTKVRVFQNWLVENLVPTDPTGTIRLRDADPRSEPLIDEKLYADDLGVERIARGLLFVRDLMSDPSISGKGVADFEVIPGPLVANLADMKSYVKRWFSYGHHISGGCQMGKQTNPMAVLDTHLRVRGTSGLRVVDTSVYPPPFLHGFNTSRAGYVVGEAAGELIAMDY
jgi:choline dehydrogenase